MKNKKEEYETVLRDPESSYYYDEIKENETIVPIYQEVKFNKVDVNLKTSSESQTSGIIIASLLNNLRKVSDMKDDYVDLIVVDDHNIIHKIDSFNGTIFIDRTFKLDRSSFTSNLRRSDHIISGQIGINRDLVPIMGWEVIGVLDGGSNRMGFISQLFQNSLNVVVGVDDSALLISLPVGFRSMNRIIGYSGTSSIGNMVISIKGNIAVEAKAAFNREGISKLVVNQTTFTKAIQQTKDFMAANAPLKFKAAIKG